MATMRTTLGTGLLGFGLVLAIAACSRSEMAADAPMGAAPASPEAAAEVAARDGAGFVGQQNAPGSFLAYEHHASIRTDGEQIAGRVSAVREACMSQRHGNCAVLSENQQSGDYPNGTIRMRAEPKAIGPLVDLAANGAEIAQRSTTAEDLADAVRDNGLRRARLTTQHARLSEFIARPDVTAQDLITLSGQLASIEAELQYAEQEAAQQQRRIATNLLTLEFQTSGVTIESSEVRKALGNSVDVLDISLATLITILAALLPFALLGLVGFWVIRALLRRRRRAMGGPSGPIGPV